MSDGIADIGGRNKLANFVENGGDGFILEFWIHPTKLVDPKIFEGGIGKLADNFFPIIFVGKNFNDMSKIGTRSINQGKDSISENVFKSGTPRDSAIKFFKNRNNAGSNQFFLGFIFGLQDVEGVNIFGVGRIEIAAIVDAVTGDVVENSVAKITVRIDDGNSPAFADVVDGHIGNESGFARARFTDDISVAATVFALFDTKDSIFVSEFSFGKKGNIGFLFGSSAVGNRQVFRRIGIKFFAPSDVGKFGNFVGKVPNGGKLFGIEYLAFEVGKNFPVGDRTEKFATIETVGRKRFDEIASRIGISAKRGGN